MSLATLIQRTAVDGTPIACVPFPAGTEGAGLVHYVIAHKPPLCRGMEERFLLYLVLDSDGLRINDNLPVACVPTLALALARAAL